MYTLGYLHKETHVWMNYTKCARLLLLPMNSDSLRTGTIESRSCCLKFVQPLVPGVHCQSNGDEDGGMLRVQPSPQPLSVRCKQASVDTWFCFASPRASQPPPPSNAVS